MYQLIGEHPDVVVYLILVVIEQVLIVAPGTWPYRYGIPVRFKPFDLSFEEASNRFTESRARLHFKVNDLRKEIYFRNMFPLWSWGPLLFTGQILFEDRGRIVIRMVPLTALGVVYLLLDSIGTFQLYGFITAFLMVLLIVYYYRWLVGRLNIFLG